MRRMRLAALTLLGLMLLGASPALAILPAATAHTDTSRATLGDRLGVRLELRYGPDEEPVPPDLEAWLQGLSPVPATMIGPVERDGQRLLTYQTQIQLFQLGDQRVPPLDVRFATTHGDTLVCATDPLAIQVVSVREVGDQEPRDIQPPVRVPGGVALWVVVAFALLALAALAALVYRWMMRRDIVLAPPSPPEPVDHAAEFVRIAGLGLVERGELKEFYSLLADNLRRFLEQSLAVEAMEQTTWEVVCRLQSEGLETRLLADVSAYLAMADLVKFARMTPDLPQARRAPEAGISLVRRVNAHVAAQRAEAARLEAELLRQTEPQGHSPDDGISPSPEAVEHTAGSGSE